MTIFELVNEIGDFESLCLGVHGIEINIHGCQPNLEMAIYVIMYLLIAIESHCNQSQYR